jgi:hypothetical protein
MDIKNTIKKVDDFDRKSNKFLIKLFVALIILGAVGKAVGLVEDRATDEWTRYKEKLVATEIANKLRDQEIVVDPRNLTKKQINSMNREDLLMANYLLRLELENFHRNMDSIKELSETRPMY